MQDSDKVLDVLVNDGIAAANAEIVAQASLPPDPEGQNDDRAKWAQVALDAFQQETGTDELDALPDLLCDLMHWADRNSFAPFNETYFNDMLDRARSHYAEETERTV